MTLFNRFKDICLEGVPAEYLFEKFNRAAGNEIEDGKIFSPRSSSALCMNAFGWFIERPEMFPPISGLENIDWPAISVDIECELRFPWRGGRSPWLDAVIETENHLIGVESKRFEPFTKSTDSKMSVAYWRDVWGPDMEGYEFERNKFRDNPKHYQHLSSRQLVAHSLGVPSRMADETRRRYLFVAIDRATRWVFIRVFTAKTAANARRFLRDLERACPMRIRMILTDNGKEFTDRLFGLRKRAATGTHEFDKLCTALNIKHRLTPPKSPQTNGMVERFNGRVEEVLQSHHFRSGEELETTLHRYVWLYNQKLPQSALGSKTPLQAMKKWHKLKPEMFKKRPYFLPGYDT